MGGQGSRRRRRGEEGQGRAVPWGLSSRVASWVGVGVEEVEVRGEGKGERRQLLWWDGAETLWEAAAGDFGGLPAGGQGPGQEAEDHRRVAGAVPLGQLRCWAKFEEILGAELSPTWVWAGPGDFPVERVVCAGGATAGKTPDKHPRQVFTVSPHSAVRYHPGEVMRKALRLCGLLPLPLREAPEHFHGETSCRLPASLP